MIILTIKTDQGTPSICLYDDQKLVLEDTWVADRQLALELPKHVKVLCEGSGKHLEDIGAIVCFAGPGSFTGLRIGHTFANALSYARNIPIVSASGDKWAAQGIGAVLSGENQSVVLPEYGSEAHITLPKTHVRPTTHL